ncbi:MAG: hypothetical protein JXA66_04035 [Oligoflexia bacterium]|nr:hypothetical protein [Oligoflexia bacterium]
MNMEIVKSVLTERTISYPESFLESLIQAEIPLDRIEMAREDGSLDTVYEIIQHGPDRTFFSGSREEKQPHLAIIGAGDFAISLIKATKPSVNIICYDIEPVRNIFSQTAKLSTNKSFALRIPDNVVFTSSLKKAFTADYILLAVPASALSSVFHDIRKYVPDVYRDKQYILVSKGFVGRGYIPHRWLEKSGIPFERMIWASGGNVARDVIAKKGLKFAVVSINKNRKGRKVFAGFFNRKYLVPQEYSGSALLACELGGILKNYYAGLGRYVLVRFGEQALEKYKHVVRREFRSAVRLVSGAPSVSLRGWIIRKASHGPAFWEDLDVTIRGGRNGRFGEMVFNSQPIADVLESLGLVESFQTVFSTLSLFNRLSRRALKRLPVLKAILEIYEDLHIEYLERGDAQISDENLLLLKETENRLFYNTGKKKRWYFF